MTQRHQAPSIGPSSTSGGARGESIQDGRLVWRIDTASGSHNLNVQASLARNIVSMTIDGRTWTLSGEHERATYKFSEDGRSQEISWEWKPGEGWLPLCDRTAHRIG